MKKNQARVAWVRRYPNLEVKEMKNESRKTAKTGFSKIIGNKTPYAIWIQRDGYRKLNSK